MKRLFPWAIRYRLLLLLIVAASCVRVFVCFQHNPLDYLSSDMLRHWNNGVRFPGGGYTGAGDPIVYQVYVFVLHKLAADNKLLFAGISKCRPDGRTLPQAPRAVASAKSGLC